MYIYDLEALTEEQRQEYVAKLCRNLNIPDDLGLIMLGYIEDASGGPRRLVPWIKRAGTEKIRADRGISVVNSEHHMIGDSTIMFKVTGKDKDGRQEIGIGSKTFTGLVGDQKDDAIMTADTRANRRMTLQFIGAGLLDESEVSGRIKDAPTGPVSKLQLAETKRNNLPGKDVTEKVTGLEDQAVVAKEGAKIYNEAMATAPVEPTKETQEQYEVRIKKIRQDAIDFLNQKSVKSNEDGNFVGVTTTEIIKETTEPVKKPRKPRTKKIEMGPSEVPVAAIPAAVKPEPVIVAPAVAPVAAAVESTPPTQPPVAIGKRLTPEQVKPFRQRLFRIVNDYLEPNGFAPKEGIGNADKMRQFANVMFPEVNNMHELTVEQWEKYLTALEQKIQKEGAASTAKYIEDAIGI